ncbi:MAG TPA: aldo/keto reductase [bacterium]|nr:aldo/keto reductase [bacterium]
MQYRDFGKTGIKMSALGFGAMRLPHEMKNGVSLINTEESIRIILRAFELGVNYIDTARGYGDSEIVVGKALKKWKKNRIYLSTKVPVWNMEKRGDYRSRLEEQLKRLDTSSIDFFHFHGISYELFESKVKKLKLFKEALKAVDEGLIKHISFSSHDKPAEIMKIIEEGAFFSSMLCQYNLLDRANEDAMEFAYKKGIAVVVMGPVGGGRLASSELLLKEMNGKVRTTPELALRFVLSNPNVSVAISGMNTMNMVEENVRAASIKRPLTKGQLASLEEFIRERKSKREIPCTGCEYCMPCPQGVRIPHIFQLMNYATVYGLKELARERYGKIKSTEKEKKEKADACVECGQCEEKCPQKIDIIKQLKKVHKTLG